MRAMRAEGFDGYQDLKLTDIPSPSLSEGRVLVRMSAAEQGSSPEGAAPRPFIAASGPLSRRYPRE